MEIKNRFEGRRRVFGKFFIIRKPLGLEDIGKIFHFEIAT
jgi:hypothetical protein